MSGFGLYLTYIAVSVKAQAQYKASFLMSAAGQFVYTVVELAGIWALFDRFGQLAHWQLAEVCFFYGVVNMVFAVADALSTGFDRFGSLYIRTGDYDRLLLRPRSPVLQLLGEELALRRVGRFAQGAIVFAWACGELAIAWSPASVMLLLATMVSGVCLFLGLIVIQATLAFWTVESLEIMSTLTHGGVTTVQYPLDIYRAWFRKFFTYFVPIACVSYYPLVAVMGVADPLESARWLQYLSPMAGFAFLLVALGLFRMGTRHYRSVGS